MRRRLSLLAAVGLLVSPAACGVSEPDAAAPFHALPDDAVAVSGTADCELSDQGTNTHGADGGLLVVCDLDMSDARVSGTETHDRFHYVVDGPGGFVWVADEAVIVNAGGTWRGSAQAAEDHDGIPSGEAHYFGEGAHEGLEFHYYFFHADLGEAAEYRGWISGGG